HAMRWFSMLKGWRGGLLTWSATGGFQVEAPCNTNGRGRVSSSPMNERSAKPVPLFLVDSQRKCSRGAGAHFFDYRLHLRRHLVERRNWASVVPGQHDRRCGNRKSQIGERQSAAHQIL